MRTLFIPGRSTVQLKIDDNILERLPEKIVLISTIQHLHNLEDVRKRLESMGKKVKELRGSHAAHASQVLGCTTFPPEQLEDVDALFYIGTGQFHPKALALRSGKEIHIYNPASEKYEVLKDKEVEGLRKRQEGARAVFLTSERIGLLVTVKKGQRFLQGGEDMLEAVRERWPDKKFYVLAAGTFSPSELENFPFIECFVNTGCPNLSYDEGYPKPVVNLDYLLLF